MATTSSAGPTRLGLLLSESFAYCTAHWQTLLLGIVVFGVLNGLITLGLGAKALQTVNTGMESMGIDTDRMAELGERMEAGDEAALGELEALMNAQFGNMSDDDIAKKMVGPGMAMAKSLVPAIGLSILISILIGFLSNAYFALVAVEGKDIAGTMNRIPKVILPLFGVALWSFLRTFAWIPFIGIIPLIILGPRFVAAPLIYLTEGKGVMGSVSSSYARTRGYWGKIIGNVIVAAIIVYVAIIVVNIVLGMLLLSMIPVMVVVKQVVMAALPAFLTVFAMRLARTVLANPRA